MISNPDQILRRTDLEEKNVKALKALALSLGVKRPSVTRKADLISEIMAAQKVKKTPPEAKRRSTSKNSSKEKALAPKESDLKKTPPARKRSKAPTVQPFPNSDHEKAPSPAPFEHKFETPVHPVPMSTSSPYDNLGELPESYGTGRLFFAARDPYWIYSYWDYSWQQLDDMRRAARYGELKLRVFSGPSLKQEVTLNPASRNWFIKVDHSNCDYHAEFGYYDHQGNFQITSRSRPTRTPADQVSPNTQARFVTIPFHLSFHDLYAMVRAYFKDGEELADVLHRLQASGFRFPFDYEGADNSQDSSNLLDHMFGKEVFRRIQMGSEVVTEWLRHRITEETSSGILTSSSPFGSSFGVPKERGFWFNVNAELIVYGATDPNARVVFDGKRINLKPDGTFRFQFALPDGAYDLPVSAESPDQVETRRVFLRFVRDTAKDGEVGVVPHPRGLEPIPKIKSNEPSI
jgi:uncharacterized protein